MILEKYKDTYDKFISKYEEIHVNPWHNISKEELDKIYHDLVTSMDINDKYSFVGTDQENPNSLNLFIV